MSQNISTIAADEFFGRHEELDLLKRRINGLILGYRQNIAITGGRLSGKTALLQQLLTVIKDHSFVPIYIEVRAETMESFIERFIGTLLYSYFRREDHFIREDIAFLTARAAKETPRTYEAIKDVRRLVSNREYTAAYNALLDITTVTKEETGKPCVVILDEFHNLDRLKIKNPYSYFGKKIMVQKNTMYIVASSKPTVIRNILSEKLTLLFGHFEVIHLEGFEDDTCLEFIQKKLDNRSIEEHLRNYLIALSDKNPFYLNVLLQAAVRIADEYGTKNLTEAVIVKAIERLIFHDKGLISQHLSNMLSPITSRADARICEKVLVAISRGYFRVSQMRGFCKANTDTIRRLIDNLLGENLIGRYGNYCVIEDPVLSFWLKFVAHKKETTLISLMGHKLEDFRSTVQGDIDGFVKEDRRDPFERIADLFKQFSNETIPLAERNVRLPAFDRVEVKSASGFSRLLFMRNRTALWSVYMAKNKVTEQNISDYLKSTRSIGKDCSRKIIIPLGGIDKNAILEAKNSKMWIWQLKDINFMAHIFGARKIVFNTQPCR